MEHRSVVQQLPSKHEDMDSITSKREGKGKRERGGEREGGGGDREEGEGEREGEGRLPLCYPS